VFKEIDDHWNEIVEKSGTSEEELKLEFDCIKPQIKPFSVGEYGEFLEHAMHISVDPDDIDFFALALKFSCPIWSYDRHLKLQSEVKILETKDVLDLIRELGGEI
jgi:predicted nucleic acid-binding protein